MYSKIFGSDDKCKKLLNEIDKLNNIHGNKTPTVKLILELIDEIDSTKLNCVDKKNRTALYKAIDIGNSDISLQLIEKMNQDGLNIPYRYNNQQITPLICALINNQLEIAIMLVDKMNINGLILYDSINSKKRTVHNYVTQILSPKKNSIQKKTALTYAIQMLVPKKNTVPNNVSKYYKNLDLFNKIRLVETLIEKINAYKSNNSKRNHNVLIELENERVNALIELLKVIKVYISLKINNKNKSNINTIISKLEDFCYMLIENITQDLYSIKFNSHTLLMIVANIGLEGIVNFLINHPQITLQKLNIQNNDGNTALIIAVKNNNKEIIELLIKKMDPNGLKIQNNNRDTALMIAVKNNNKEIVKLLIENMDSYGLNIQNNDGDTALMIAANNNYIDIVGLMIENYNISFNGFKIKNNNGDTALIIAVKNIHINIVKLFIGKMKNNELNIQNNNRDTALIVAIKNCAMKLFNAANKHNKEIIELLIENMNQDGLNIQNNNKDTALIVAVRILDMKNLNILNFLINKMTSEGINIQNNDKDTALITALKYRKPDIATILIMHPKMNMDGLRIRDNDGDTAYDIIKYNISEINRRNINEYYKNAARKKYYDVRDLIQKKYNDAYKPQNNTSQKKPQWNNNNISHHTTETIRQIYKEGLTEEPIRPSNNRRHIRFNQEIYIKNINNINKSLNKSQKNPRLNNNTETIRQIYKEGLTEEPIRPPNNKRHIRFNEKTYIKSIENINESLSKFRKNHD
jgi:ankyrin repeat protein